MPVQKKSGNLLNAPCNFKLVLCLFSSFDHCSSSQLSWLDIFQHTNVFIMLITLHVLSFFFLSSQVCIEDKCIRSSAFILNMMNQDLEPCDDLYSFSCGRWIKMNNATLRVSKLTVLQFMQLHLQDEIGNVDLVWLIHFKKKNFFFPFFVSFHDLDCSVRWC